MKKLILLLFLGCSSLFVSAQKCSQIDFDEIYKKNNDKKSPFFFSKLLKRYQALDTTMTPEEYKHLYYGYTRSTFYSPIDPEATMLRRLVEDGKLKEAKESIKLLDKTNPVNLNLAYSKALLAFKEKNQKDEKVFSLQSQGLMTTILTSGDGLSAEKAFVVTAIEDEYFIMKMFKLKFVKQENMGTCDVMTIELPNMFNIEKIYFNKEKSSEYMKKMFEDKK